MVVVGPSYLPVDLMRRRWELCVERSRYGRCFEFYRMRVVFVWCVCVCVRRMARELGSLICDGKLQMSKHVISTVYVRQRMCHSCVEQRKRGR